MSEDEVVFTEEELADVYACAHERHIPVEQLIHDAVLCDLVR